MKGVIEKAGGRKFSLHLMLLLILVVMPVVFGAGEQNYKEVSLPYFSERTPATQAAAQGSAGTQAYFLAKIPLDQDNKQVTYALLPTAKKDIISHKVRYLDGDLYVYNNDGTTYAILPDIKTVSDKETAPLQARNTLIETQNDKGEVVEKLYADDTGRTLRMLYQKNSPVTSLFYDPATKKTMPVTPDAAEYVMSQQPENPEKGLLIMQGLEKTNPSFLAAVKKKGVLIDAKDDTVSYELAGDTTVASHQRNSIRWETRTKPDGTIEKIINGNAVDEEVAEVLEETYGDEITQFDGKTAIAGDKRIIVEGNTARVFRDNTELEQVSGMTEDGVKKVALARNPTADGYAQREVRWKDDKGVHTRTEKNEHGVPTMADEIITDAKGNKIFVRTDFAQGKPSVSTIYDVTGYPIGRTHYDENGKPIPEQSSRIEYVNKLGRVCDPTRDYTCPYQQVNMRIRVGNTIITDSCKGGDQKCKTTKECINDLSCKQIYEETLRSFQRANLGVALNNAYIAARAAEIFNVKNFEFIDKFFSSEFGQLIQGEPSFGYCGTFSKKKASQEGVLIADTPLKTLLAYVAGTRSTVVYPNRTKEYLYKLNYFVDAQQEDITFNVDLYRGETNVISLLTQDATVPKGQTASARAKSSIVQYSRNFYDKLCLRSSKGMTCNRMSDVTELTPLQEVTPQGPSTGRKGSIRGI